MKNANEEMPSFNLIDEPWILARDKKGTTREYSLMEIFERAVDLECLCNDLPTQDFAILRVLLAILQRAISPILDEEDKPADVWGKLWHSSSIPMKAVSVYLKEWHERFNLFDSQHPFMQVANLQTCNGRITEPKKILADIPDGDPLFSLKSGSALETLGFADAARWLIHAHAFDTAGIKSGVIGDPLVKGGKSYPIGVGWLGNLGGVYFEGKNLKETILLNSILWSDRDNFDELFYEDDLPVWEKTDFRVWGGNSFPHGRADLYTWQTRRISLIPKSQRVVGLVLTNGDKLAVQNMQRFENMTAWRRSPAQEKKLGVSPVYMPVTHTSGRAFWRGLSVIFAKGTAAEGSAFCSPGLIEWINFLSSANGGKQIDAAQVVRMHAVGYEYGTQNSVMTDLIDDSLIVNSFLLSPEGEQLTALACECVRVTDNAINSLGKFAANLMRASGGNKELEINIKEAAKDNAYFEIDHTFREWIASLNNQTSPDDARTVWYKKARTIIRLIASKMLGNAGPSTITGCLITTDYANRKVWFSAARCWNWFIHDLSTALPISNEMSELKEENL